MIASGLWEESDPCWECELIARLESVVLCVRPSSFASYSNEHTQLYATSKCSFVDIEQGGWGTQFTQGGAIQEGVSPDAPHCFGQPKLLQLRAMGKGASEDLTDFGLRDVY